VQWLLLDFQTDFAANQMRRFVLKTSADAAAVPAAEVKVTDGGDAIMIDTGAAGASRAANRAPTWPTATPSGMCDLRGELKKGAQALGWSELWNRVARFQPIMPERPYHLLGKVVSKWPYVQAGLKDESFLDKPEPEPAPKKNRLRRLSAPDPR